MCRKIIDAELLNFIELFDETPKMKENLLSFSIFFQYILLNKKSEIPLLIEKHCCANAMFRDLCKKV